VKNTVRVLLAVVFAAMLTEPALGINAYAGYEHFPYYWTAMPTPKGHFRAGLDITPWDFECYGGTGTNGFMFEPKVSASYGICDEGDIGLELNRSPGFGVFGEHEFMKGDVDLSAGGRGSYSWYNGFAAGRLELSPRVIASNTENNKPFPWQANLGLSYNFIRAGYTEGPSNGSTLGIVGGVGVPIDLKIDKEKFKLQPEFGFHWRVYENNAAYTPNFEGSIGLQLRYGF
jgi:hypothetical protein